MKKKILYLITKGNWGGAQRYVFDLATHLPRVKFDIAVATGSAGLLTEKLAADAVRTIHIPALRRDMSVLKEIGAFFALVRTFRAERPDIVHLNSSKAAGLGALAARITCVPRIVFTAHGWPFEERRNALARSAIWLASYFTALLSHAVIVVSDHDRALARNMPFVGRKTTRIYNGIAPLVFGSGALIGRAFPEGARITGTIGELTGNKNQQELIECARRDTAICVAIVGEGENRPLLEALIRAYGLEKRVKLFGFVPVEEALPGFDVFALPSRKEGLPYALLEAGAAGLPVAATAVGGIPDIIENDKTGLLAPPYVMADALRKLLTDRELREELGGALKERVEHAFSFDEMFRQTLHLYERVTGPHADECPPDGKRC